jgi:hypothetical protein
MYEKHSISQKKLWKLSREDLNNFVNLDTWEVLDIVHSKKESSSIYIKLNYKFTMINKDIDHKLLIKDLWPTYYGYLLLLVTHIKTDNRIDYTLLWLEKPWLDKLKGIFKKKWIVLWLRLENRKKNEYFVNPYISSYWREVSLELVEEFSEVNEKIFNIKL